MSIKRGIQSYYSPAQVQAYLHRVGFPSTFTHPGSDLKTLEFRADLGNLERLVRFHLLAFPFEITQLHYSAEHVVDVRADSIFNRLVEDREGGSWCFGHNGIFLGVLRGLGYRAYAVPARVNKAPAGSEPEYTNLVHLVLLVQLDNDNDNESTDLPARPPTTFLVDVGFGGTGAVRPIPLKVGELIPGSATPEQHRLTSLAHPNSSISGAQEWALQYRCGTYQPEWITLFMFYEKYEFFMDDWIAASQWLSRYPGEVFGGNVIAIKHFDVESEGRGEDKDARERWVESPMGRLVLIGRKVQKRVGDRSETVKEFATERERVKVLKEDFGIVVREEDVCNLMGREAALPQ